jgi:hypothetical protein
VARRAYVPPELAPEARELLRAFAEWASEPRQAQLLSDDSWTWTGMIDLFLLECGANGDLEVEGDAGGEAPVP